MIRRKLCCFATFVILMSDGLGRASDFKVQRLSYYLQIIQANNLNRPPQKTWKLVGPRLQKKLSPVFQWKNYWEVAQQRVDLTPGAGKSVSFANRRRIQIAWKDSHAVMIRLYREGKLVRKEQHLLSEKLLILGGDSGKDEAWFIVLRRDKPKGR